MTTQAESLRAALITASHEVEPTCIGEQHIPLMDALAILERPAATPPTEGLIHEAAVLVNDGISNGRTDDEIARAVLALAPTPPTEGLDARLREFLVLRPVGTVGPDKVPWFQHCGISHAEGAECVVCAALAATPPTEGLWSKPRHISPCNHYATSEDGSTCLRCGATRLAATPPAERPSCNHFPGQTECEWCRAAPPAEEVAESGS